MLGPRTGWHHLRLDPEQRTVAFDLAGSGSTLGSIGKGYAIDRARRPDSLTLVGRRPPSCTGGVPASSRWVRRQGSWAALGDLAPEPVRAGISTRRDPITQPGARDFGSSFQQFVIDGQVYGHIIDPRSGRAAQGPASVTVLAPTAAQADALSTAFYLLGHEAASAYIARHPEIGALIVESGPPKSRHAYVDLA